jgi:IS5 family transposase
MRQQTLSSQASFEKYGRKSRRELFLDEMERGVPWPELEALVEPHYPNSSGAKSLDASIERRLPGDRDCY